jgi:hypothetical protein
LIGESVTSAAIVAGLRQGAAVQEELNTGQNHEGLEWWEVVTPGQLLTRVERECDADQSLL